MSFTRRLALIAVSTLAGCETEPPCTSQADCQPGEGCTGEHTCAGGQLPTAVAPAPLALEAGKSATFLITGQDAQSAPGELTIRIKQQPTLGVLSGGGEHPPAQYTYTPSPSQSGEDHIVFEIIDPHGNVSTPVSIDLSIAPAPAPPPAEGKAVAKAEKKQKGKKAVRAERRGKTKKSTVAHVRPKKAKKQVKQRELADEQVDDSATYEAPKKKKAPRLAHERPKKAKKHREVADAGRKRGKKAAAVAEAEPTDEASPELARNDASADTRVNAAQPMPEDTPAPGAPAEVSWFVAEPPSVNVGGTSELTWESQGADSCSLDGGAPQPARGKLTITPQETHVYELRCTGAGGEASARVNIQVDGGTPKAVAYAPAIEKFEAVQTSIASGDEATLVWSSSHTSGCEVDGAGVVPPSGEVRVKPVSTATFVLVCHSTMGDVTSRTTVSVMEDAPLNWGLVALLSSVALGSAGGTILAITANDEDKIRDNEFRDFAAANSNDKASAFSRLEGAVSKHNSRVIAGWGLVGLALVSSGVSAVIYMSDDKQADVSVGVGAAPEQAGLLLRGHF